MSYHLARTHVIIHIKKTNFYSYSDCYEENDIYLCFFPLGTVVLKLHSIIQILHTFILIFIPSYLIIFKNQKSHYKIIIG